MPTKPLQIEEPDADQLETWQNATRGRVVLRRVGALGQVRYDMIGAGKTFHITPQERRMNQEVAASEKQDFFLNGTLQPINLADTEDASILLDNPNLLGDEDQIRRLFKASPDVFAERLATIDNETALERLKEIAYQDETNATLNQVRMIEARLEQVAPEVENVHPGVAGAESSTTEGGERRIKAVTPR
jgi:hypothetical protein